MERKIKEVAILTNSIASELALKIDYHLGKGWAMKDALKVVAINDSKYHVKYVQMMVMYEEIE